MMHEHVTHAPTASPGADPAPAAAGPAPQPSPHAHAVAAHADDVAHHFTSRGHQYEAAKLGMWLFLGTEFLLFGGLFCLYAVLRYNHPGLFTWASEYLSTTLGAINTVVLIVSSLTMALAVRAAQLGHRPLLIVMLLLTIGCGGGFMGIKYIEYSDKFAKRLIPGRAFYVAPVTPPAATAPEDEALAAAAPPPSVPVGDATKGRSLWMATCMGCHGDQGQGIPGQGFDLRGSEFVSSKSDAELLNFIRQGRMPFDPASRTKIQMPARGGNPMLKDGDLLDIVAFIRTLPAAPAVAAGGGDGDPAAAVEVTGLDAAGAAPMPLPRASAPRAPSGPSGIVADWPGASGPAAPAHVFVDPRSDPARPPNAHLFFGVYFLMTGLHGVHVVAGMIAIGVLTIGSVAGRYGARSFTHIELVGLYWHVVDLIWIFLFPLLYLIH